MVVARDGQPWQTIANGTAVAEVVRYDGLRMPQDAYLCQSELNVTAIADGRVEIAAQMNAVITE